MSWFSYDSKLNYQDINIGDLCFGGEPCKHRVKIRNVKVGRWPATKIYQLYRDNGLETPDHFKNKLI